MNAAIHTAQDDLSDCATEREARMKPSEILNDLKSRLWHRRHRLWEPFDRVEMALVPRYKTSGLSGDEWRVGWQVKLYFKGIMVKEFGGRTLRDVIAFFPARLEELTCPTSNEIIEREGKACDQPGCSDDAVARYRLKALFSDQGEALHPDEGKFADHYRQFCKRHLRRGDCGREDADDNYEPLDGIGPDGSTNVIESPSTVMIVDEIESLESALKQLAEDAGE